MNIRQKGGAVGTVLVIITTFMMIAGYSADDAQNVTAANNACTNACGKHKLRLIKAERLGSSNKVKCSCGK